MTEVTPGNEEEDVSVPVDRPQWSVREGRRTSSDGSYSLAYVAHILDENGQSVRNRWFNDRFAAEQWAKETLAMGGAVSSLTSYGAARTHAPAVSAPFCSAVSEITHLADQRLGEIARGALCIPVEVRAIAHELLALRQRLASVATEQMLAPTAAPMAPATTPETAPPGPTTSADAVQEAISQALYQQVPRRRL